MKQIYGGTEREGQRRFWRRGENDRMRQSELNE